MTMPLLDHFRPPLYNTTSWEGFRHFNLYCDLLQRIERTDPVFAPESELK